MLHGNAKTDEEIALAVEHGVGLVVVDSADDVDRLEATVPDGASQDVLVRIIPGVTADTHAPRADRSRGVEVRSVTPARDAADPAASSGARGSGCRACTSTSAHRSSTCEPFAESVAPVAALGEFPIYDLGGGLGARYTWADEPPTIADYLDALVGAAREHLPAEAQIIIEPGAAWSRRGGDDLSGHDGQARQRSPSSRSTAGWATTSRSRCSTSVSRPASRAGSMDPT